MFHADHSIIEVISHGLVAVLFIGAGAVNAFSTQRSRQHVAHFSSLGFPFPLIVLCAGYTLQFSGGVLVLIDWHADIGALFLIAFTIVAMLSYHHFWRIEETLRRNTARLFFLNNCGVLGGLLLIAEPALLGMGV